MLKDTPDKSKRLMKLISAADSIAIIGHVKPDGDCIGSILGLANYIIDNYQNKTVDVFAEAFPSSFKILNGARKIKHDAPRKGYDLAISVDVSDTDRLGKFQDLYSRAITTICIDHHVSNKGFGDFSYIDADASSAAEVLCDLVDMDKVSERTANCLYLGMVHDTGVFKYSSTSRHTMELAGHLIELGADSQYIIDETFYKKTYKQNMLMAKTILESMLHFDGKVITGYISKATFKQFKATSMDTEGIVEQLRLTDGVEVAVFVYQKTRNTYKFSLRSKTKVDVSVIASGLGGGGHKRAAGVDLTGNIDDLMGVILGKIKDQLDGKNEAE